MSYLFFHRYGTGIDFGIEVYILLLKAFSKIDRRLLLKGILLNQYYSSLFRLHNLHRQRDSLQITIWLVWGAEHADEGSRRVKTLLPSSVTDNGFAALDIKDYTDGSRFFIFDVCLRSRTCRCTFVFLYIRFRLDNSTTIDFTMEIINLAVNII